MKFLIRFLPPEYRALLTLGTRIMSSFDTKEEALRFFSVVAESLKDGRISPPEWAKIGSKAGIFESNGKE